MSSYRIAIIPGDGVGNEVALKGTKILKAVADKHAFHVETKNFDWGCDYYLKKGRSGYTKSCDENDSPGQGEDPGYGGNE